MNLKEAFGFLIWPAISSPAEYISSFQEGLYSINILIFVIFHNFFTSFSVVPITTWSLANSKRPMSYGTVNNWPYCIIAFRITCLYGLLLRQNKTIVKVSVYIQTIKCLHVFIKLLYKFLCRSVMSQSKQILLTIAGRRHPYLTPLECLQ
jgi:hypothetical protein